MFDKLRIEIAQNLFYRSTKGIFKTPPIRVVAAPVTYISMVTNNYVQMYILCMKSFYRIAKKGNLVVIIDKTLTEQSKELLSQHFIGIQFQFIEQIDVGPCQKGGTWERLISILERTKDEYVIQIDCDTMALGSNLNEVIECIENNRAFTLSGGDLEIVSIAEAAQRASKINHNYIGLAVERVLPNYPESDKLRYIRGSSGFAGFAKGGFERKRIDEFHTIMGQLMGARWNEWGTEQCASNFSIANSPNSIVLPYPKYANFEPNIDPKNSDFLHFIGTYRYRRGTYERAAKKLISELNA